MLTVSYRNKLIDFVAFNVYTLPRLRAMRILAFLFLLYLIYLLMPVLRSADSHILLNVVAVTTTIVLIFGGTSFLILSIVLLAYVPKLNKGLLTEHTVTLSENMVVETTQWGRTESAWGGMAGIRRSKRYIFLYISEHAAHVIPRKAFASSDEADAFYRYACDSYTNANAA